MAVAGIPDQDLERVASELLRVDPDGERTATVLRKTLDQLYDGQHTGRYRWDQLHKTEKTHCGTLVEINLHREFGFEDGKVMDYRVGGVEVDCKYSQTVGGWMIPTEAMGHLCIVISADDPLARWSMGLIRITESVLTAGGNRDAKRTVSALGRKSIRWLFDQAHLPPNILLQLPRPTVDRIMEMDSGQKRVNEIFRVAQGQRIGRGVIATLAQQEDYMKRVRGNGGARSRLQPEGIIILGQYDEHRRIADALGIPAPQRGESVSVRVTRANSSGKGTVVLDGVPWRIATKHDPLAPAPDCPHD